MISPSKNKPQSIFSHFSKILQRNVKKLANFFKLQSISILSMHSQPKMNNTSFCALVELLLTKLNHNINVYIDVFAVNSDTKIGDGAPFMIERYVNLPY